MKQENKHGARERKSSPTSTPFALAVDKSHVVYIFSHTLSRDFEAKTSFGQSNTIKNLS